jgi:hypothetical protein
MKTFKQFNEGLRDKMIPKPMEEIEDKFSKLNIDQKLRVANKYKLRHNLSDEEIKEFYLKQREEFKYLILAPSTIGLEIILTDDGKEELKGLKEERESLFLEDDFYDFFEDIRSNSDYEYISNLSNIDIMIDAPGIIYNCYDEDGEIVITDDSDIYYFDRYAIVSFFEELYEDGKVFFNRV